MGMLMTLKLNGVALRDTQREPSLDEIAKILDIPREEVVFAPGEAMSKLSDREKRILGLRFFRGKTQMEVSAEVGISQAQVSRLEKNALSRIRKEL